MFHLKILGVKINNLTEASNIDILYPGLGPRAGQNYTLIFLNPALLMFCFTLNNIQISQTWSIFNQSWNT